MPKEPEMIEIEKGSANVYEDPGLGDSWYPAAQTLGHAARPVSGYQRSQDA